eukprot:1161831-Pelagomonas_calceolata.AAC.6
MMQVNGAGGTEGGMSIRTMWQNCGIRQCSRCSIGSGSHVNTHSWYGTVMAYVDGVGVAAA